MRETEKCVWVIYIRSAELEIQKVHAVGERLVQNCFVLLQLLLLALVRLIPHAQGFIANVTKTKSFHSEWFIHFDFDYATINTFIITLHEHS